MTWCNINNPCTSSNINMSNNMNITNPNHPNNDDNNHVPISDNNSNNNTCSTPDGLISRFNPIIHSIACPSCGHHMPLSDHHDQGESSNSSSGLNNLPAGVKFDPTDAEILGHLEAKVMCDMSRLHPLLDDFIPTIQGQNGICYTHPEKLPGVTKDGVMRHFFHCPSKAYTTGTRKRRKVHTDEDGGETRWHKTGKTRPIVVNGAVKGFKKILVLYTNYGRQKKPEKTNWVMHQYHLGQNEEEKDGEYVLSKVFYQTQPRQCGSNIKELPQESENSPLLKTPLNYYHPSFLSYDHHHHHHHNVVGEQNRSSASQLLPNLILQGDGSSFSIAAARKS